MAKNLPKIDMKLINNNDLPLHFCGICYVNMVLAIIRVVPKPTPDRINANKKVINCSEYVNAKLAKT